MPGAFAIFVFGGRLVAVSESLRSKAVSPTGCIIPLARRQGLTFERFDPLPFKRDLALFFLYTLSVFFQLRSLALVFQSECFSCWRSGAAFGYAGKAVGVYVLGRNKVAIVKQSRKGNLAVRFVINSAPILLVVIPFTNVLHPFPFVIRKVIVRPLTAELTIFELTNILISFPLVVGE